MGNGERDSEPVLGAGAAARSAVRNHDRTGSGGGRDSLSLTLGEEPPLEDYYAHFLNLWRNPMLWLAAVLVVGAISDKGRGHAQGAAADPGS